MNEEEDEGGTVGEGGGGGWAKESGVGKCMQCVGRTVGTGVQSGCAVKPVQLRGPISGQKICTTIAPTG